jgi:hypothetical protein
MTFLMIKLAVPVLGLLLGVAVFQTSALPDGPVMHAPEAPMELRAVPAEDEAPAEEADAPVVPVPEQE